MDREEFRKVLAGGPVLCDGGTSTSLVAAEVHPRPCFEALNLTDSHRVAAVHRAFVEAGARLVETNTLAANRFKLGSHGLADRVPEINAIGVRLARETGAEIVAGSVGPLRVLLVPYGPVRATEAREAFAEQMDALAAAGADLIMIETQTDLAEVEQAVVAARHVCDLPVVASMTFTRDDTTVFGEPAGAVASRLAELEVDAIGVNCSHGPHQVLRLIREMRQYTSLPLAALPNAGGPQRQGSRISYPATPEYFAEYAAAYGGANVALIGGCCGATAQHIRAMGEALARTRPAVREGAGESRPHRGAIDR